MSRKLLIWVAFGLLMIVFGVIQFIPDANDQQLLHPSPSDTHSPS